MQNVNTDTCKLFFILIFSVLKIKLILVDIIIGFV